MILKMKINFNNNLNIIRKVNAKVTIKCSDNHKMMVKCSLYYSSFGFSINPDGS